MWVYQCLDIISTLTEGWGLYFFSTFFCKKPRFQSCINKWIIIGGFFAFVFSLTWFSELGAYKIPIIYVVSVIIVKICYKDSLYQCIISYEMSITTITMLSEGIGTLLGKFLYGENILVLIDGTSFLRWETYIMTLLVRGLTFLVLYRICRKFTYQLNLKDFLIITFVFITGYISFMYSAVENLNFHKVSDGMIYFIAAIFPVLVVLIFLYVKNTVRLREQEQKDKIQIAQLQQQFAYYQEKLKDEEKVRSVYHDMKNHLLVLQRHILQRQINSPETAEMVEKLQSQVAMYEDYVHTGNDILDIILKEKSELAREKSIAFSVTAGLNGVDFIEPLDISTIFSNALDNAIEASEKLPEEQRAILVKAGKMQNFFSVLIENNCLQNSENTNIRTTKSDDFLHGFGISNMRKAAEKYDGQLITKSENGKFVLKILLPIPARLEVQ